MGAMETSKVNGGNSRIDSMVTSMSNSVNSEGIFFSLPLSDCFSLGGHHGQHDGEHGGQHDGEHGGQHGEKHDWEHGEKHGWEHGGQHDGGHGNQHGEAGQ